MSLLIEPVTVMMAPDLVIGCKSHQTLSFVHALMPVMKFAPSAMPSRKSSGRMYFSDEVYL